MKRTGKKFARTEFSPADENRFRERQRRTDSLLEAVARKRRAMGLAPDSNKYIPLS